MAEKIVNENLSVRAAENLAKQRKSGVKKVRLKDPDTVDLENNLTAKLGLSVSIDHKGKKGGSIKIEYKSLDQLEELCKSLGKQIVGYKTQLRKTFDSRTLIGKGVLDEILLESKYHDASSIIFNHELSPIQSKEISKLTNIKISDRTELILEIFEKNAQSKEAHTQIELARLKYELPRITGFGYVGTFKKDFSQIAGGIRSKGPGEKKSEQRKRYIR